MIERNVSQEIECETILDIGSNSLCPGIGCDLPPHLMIEEEDVVFEAQPINSVCGIYFLVRKNAIVYVGQTTNIFQRLGEHIKTKPFDSVTFLPIDDPDDLDLFEAHYIEKFNPILNHGPDGKKKLPTKRVVK